MGEFANISNYLAHDIRLVMREAQKSMLMRNYVASKSVQELCVVVGKLRIRYEIFKQPLYERCPPCRSSRKYCQVQAATSSSVTPSSPTEAAVLRQLTLPVPDSRAIDGEAFARG